MSDTTPSIAIAELEKVLLLSLQALKHQYGQDGHIPLEQDFYWDIPKEQLYLVEENPEDLTIGQLSDDWRTVQEASEEDFTSFDLLKASHLLRYISHTHPLLYLP
ncbi:hypothetical protein MUN84_13595 [Hymenobacter sp. 5516J-16]|uniref:Uncharacterized protein n=1 Tax=Hymenobacter sublimis TaxID=2933777 RepID=A0ABY4J961_9BACT|nr:MULTISPECIES: hypothetical protein [Hymenobacter]UOQ75691.1 hypothetical protein MUN84_13595 [Hymenobacter sp. 5516J-16]UPL49363.1 hypothetical protein MWH26_00250 [Hymenobacter sublimis]